MSDLRDLYQEIILDHYRSPRNFVSLESPTGTAKGHNPLCGDRVQVSLQIVDGVVEAVGFQGAGCAISTASASLMTEAIRGKTVAEVQKLIGRFTAMLTERTDPEDDLSDLGKLEALTGVRAFPVRVKCATLAWHTLQAAFDPEAGQPVTPESAPVSTE